MKNLYMTIPLLAVLMMSTIALAPVFAPDPFPSLPLVAVNLTVVDGTTSYYVSTLGGAPDGFDVYNQDYPGWCIDRSTIMERGVSHFVVLYSSLDPELPAPLNATNWNAINYILNHKQGTMMEIQEAIWLFTDGYLPDISHTDAWAMINGANADPNFVPGTGEIVAVICYNAQGACHVQNTIIELRIPGRGTGLSLGYWRHNVQVYCGDNPGSYSAPYDGALHETDLSMLGYAVNILAAHAGDLPAGVDTPVEVLQWACDVFDPQTGNSAQWQTVADWFNVAAGLSTYYS